MIEYKSEESEEIAANIYMENELDFYVIISKKLQKTCLEKIENLISNITTELESMSPSPLWHYFEVAEAIEFLKSLFIIEFNYTIKRNQKSIYSTYRKKLNTSTNLQFDDNVPIHPSIQDAGYQLNRFITSGYDYIQQIANVKELSNQYYNISFHVDSMQKRILILQNQLTKIPLKQDQQSDQLKKLKSLLLSAKRHNDKLQKEINCLKLQEIENQKLNEKIKDMNEITTKYHDILEKYDKLNEKYKEDESISYQKIAQLEHNLEMQHSDYEFLHKKHESLEKSLNRGSPEQKFDFFKQTEILMEKQRYQVIITNLEAKLAASKKDLEEMTLNYMRLENGRIQLIDTLESKRKSVEEIIKKYEKILEAINSKDTKIHLLQEKILKIQFQHDSNKKHDMMDSPPCDKPANVFGERRSIPPVTLTLDTDIQKNVSDNLLEHILLDSSINNSNTDSSLNDNIMNDLIDVESDNNLLIEQVKALQNEIRRLDLENDANYLYKYERDIIFEFMFGNVSKKQELMSNVIKIMNPKHEDLEKLELFTKTEIFEKQESTISNIVNYVSRWM